MKPKNPTLSHSLLCLLALVLLLPAAGVPAGEPCDISASPCLVKLVEKLKTRGWVGIEMDVSKEGAWRITVVLPDSPAKKAGLAVGDVLRELDGVPYRKDNMAELDKIYQMLVPNRTVTYTLERQGKILKVPVKLAKVPEQLMAQWIGHHVLEAYQMLQAPRKGSGER